MMKVLRLFLITFFVLSLCGCTSEGDVLSSNTQATSNNIQIVTTIFPAYDLSRAIAGDRADLTMLIKPGAEVHSFDPSPEDILKINKADVFVYIGGENDEWVKTILESMDTSKKKIIRLMDYVTTVEEETVEGMEHDHPHSDEEAVENDKDHEHEENHEHDEEHDHEKDTADEHIWTSPKNAVIMLESISVSLCEIDPQNAELYKKNTATYSQQIQEVDHEIQSLVEESASKLLVFGDRFPFRYFAEEFGLEYRAAFTGCSTDTEASASTLAYLIDFVKENKIPYIFYIELSNQNIAKAISEQTGAGMLMLHSCQNVSKDEFNSGATYLSLMKQNTENLRKGLNNP